MRALGLSTVMRFKGKKPQFHIHYDANSPLLPQIKQLKKPEIDTLFITGSHGNYHNPSLNDLRENEIEEVVNVLKRKKVKLDNLVMDPCYSAYFITHFKELMTTEGIIYCNLSEGRQHNALELFRNYAQYKALTLGGVLFSQISMLLNLEEEANLPGPYSYPAVYIKNTNTLYYYGDADENLIEHLEENGIEVIELEDEEAYFEKLLLSSTPVDSNISRNALLENEWQKLKKYKNKLSSDRAVQELLALFKKYYKNKTISPEEYARILFPIAKKLVKKGTCPILSLAKAAVRYKQQNKTLNKDDYDEEFEAISAILHQDFTILVLNNELKTLLKEKVDYPKIAEKLKSMGQALLGEENQALLPKVLKEVLEDHPEAIQQLLKPYLELCLPTPNWGKHSFVSILLGLVAGTLAQLYRCFCLWPVAQVGIGIALLVSTTSFVLCYLRPKMKKEGLQRYPAVLQEQNIPHEQLNAFLDGASSDSSFKSLFSYRDWYYMRDYYAGMGAKEIQDERLIAAVKKKLRV